MDIEIWNRIDMYGYAEMNLALGHNTTRSPACLVSMGSDPSNS